MRCGQFATLGFISLVLQLTNSGGSAEVRKSLSYLPPALSRACSHDSAQLYPLRPRRVQWLHTISETFLGEEDFLVERFESLHGALFVVSILYLGTCSLLTVFLSAQLRELGYARRVDYLRYKVIKYEEMYTSNISSQTGWQQRAVKMEMTEPALGLHWTWAEELFTGRKKRTAEFLRFRNRFIEQAIRDDVAVLPCNFAFDQYLESHSAQNLKELVSIEPVTVAAMWAPVAALCWAAEVLGLSFGQLPETGQIDRDIVVIAVISQLALGPSPLSHAFPSAHRPCPHPYEFNFQQPLYACASPLAAFSSGGWAFGNFFQMATIKAMLRPQLAQRGSQENPILRLLPPPYILAGKRDGVGWGPLASLGELFERPFASPARNAHEALFGLLGANGPRYYLESQKLVLFNAIVSIAVMTSFYDSAPEDTKLPIVVGLVAAAVVLALIHFFGIQPRDGGRVAQKKEGDVPSAQGPAGNCL